MGTLKHIEKLEHVDPNLAGVIKTAAARFSFDSTISEGLRSHEQAIENYRKGRTKAELIAVGIHEVPLPGPKITWTLHSKHVDGRAVDIYPLLLDGKLDLGEHGLERFNEMYHIVMEEAGRAKVRIRYGGDWDQDGKLREKGETDSVHFELV